MNNGQDERPEPAHKPNPLYQPGRDSEKRNNARRGIGATLAGVGILALKFKALLLALLSFKSVLILGKVGWSFSSIFISLGAYALFWGWKFAFAFVLLLIVHEFGHWYAAKSLGLRASLPMLVPFLGAFTRTEVPRSGAVSAAVSLGGPIAGIAGAAVFYGYAVAAGSQFWYAAAHIGFLLNAFNLIPVLPFDGGAIAGVLSPRLWLAGVIAVIAFVAVTGSFSSITTLIVLILVAMSVPRAIAAWRGTTQIARPDITPAARAWIAFAYFALFAIAGVAAVATHVDPSRVA